MTGVAPCERCGVRIETTANRCPDCGYEPAALRRASVLAALALPVFLGSVAVLAVTTFPSLLAVDLAVSNSAATTFGLPAAIVSGVVLWGYTRQDRRRPTDSTVF